MSITFVTMDIFSKFLSLIFNTFLSQLRLRNQKCHSGSKIEKVVEILTCFIVILENLCLSKNSSIKFFALTSDLF